MYSLQLFFEVQGSNRSFFLAWDNAFEISVSYSYHIEAIEMNSLDNLWMSGSVKGGSSSNALTLLISGGNRIVARWPPQKGGIKLKLMDLLVLAKKSLDEPQESLGANLLENAVVKTGPVGRLTGMQIRLSILCYNKLSLPFTIHVGDWDWSGPVCTAMVRGTAPGWKRQTEHHWISGAYQTINKNGVYLTIEAGGNLRTLSLQSLLNMMINSLVLLALPRRLCAFLAVNFLGKLSKMYRGVIYQQVSISEQAATLATLVMSQRVAFAALTRGSHGIPYNTLHDEIRTCFGHVRHLSHGEIEKFVMLSFIELLKLRRKTWGSIALHEIESTWHDVNSADAFIDWQAFITASTGSATANLEDVLEVFNSRMKGSFLERAFMPGFANEEMHDEEQLSTQIGAASALPWKEDGSMPHSPAAVEQTSLGPRQEVQRFDKNLEELLEESLANQQSKNDELRLQTLCSIKTLEERIEQCMCNWRSDMQKTCDDVAACSSSVQAIRSSLQDQFTDLRLDFNRVCEACAGVLGEPEKQEPDIKQVGTTMETIKKDDARPLMFNAAEILSKRGLSRTIKKNDSRQLMEEDLDAAEGLYLPGLPLKDFGSFIERSPQYKELSKGLQQIGETVNEHDFSMRLLKHELGVLFQNKKSGQHS